MNLPFNIRPSTLEERRQFYIDFDLKKSRDWVGRKLVYLVIIGRHTNIYPPVYKQDKDTPLAIDNYHSIKEVTQYLMKFLPEGVYYDRNYYKDFSLCHTHNLRNAWNWDNFTGQELAFDLDPENVDCPIHGTLQQRMKKGQGLSFCETAFQITKNNTLELYNILTKTYTDVRIVFSGRGFHLHVFDSETKKLTHTQRKKIAETYKKYGIDTWVTEGEMRLIRLPYSLNGASSRIVTPLHKTQLERFDPAKDALPSFLK